MVAGATLGERAVVADQAHVRERSTVGEDALVGRGSSVENDVVIGARVRIQTNCYVTAYSRVEDDVFVGPGVVTLNDQTMGRHPRGEALAGSSCAAPAGWAAGPRSSPASRSAKRRSSPPVRWSPARSPREPSSWARRRDRFARSPMSDLIERWAR